MCSILIRFHDNRYVVMATDILSRQPILYHSSFMPLHLHDILLNVIPVTDVLSWLPTCCQGNLNTHSCLFFCMLSLILSMQLLRQLTCCHDNQPLLHYCPSQSRTINILPRQPTYCHDNQSPSLHLPLLLHVVPHTHCQNIATTCCHDN
ncbi:hypothetical protein NP493_592g01015 [Ridgeia piscesae]|uniref:Uncharacterized protein n=1 Tax=Ridgeia piscesae TaxID=27915 RepID=A0AAD9NQX2_RIDPI|nr:hypothetical protein NP493_592g01015 [Ridgeia piscesae]